MKEVLVESLWMLLGLAFLAVVIMRIMRVGRHGARLYRKLFGDQKKSN
jgi:hypothetical protein